MVQPILQIARDGSCLARARDAPCDCLGSCLFIHLVFHLSYIECISQSRLALKQNKKSENDRRLCLMFTANREPRSFSLWLGIFTRYKKKSAGSVRPEWAGQGCWHKIQSKNNVCIYKRCADVMRTLCFYHAKSRHLDRADLLVLYSTCK